MEDQTQAVSQPAVSNEPAKQTLAKVIRAKYPDAYKDLSDTELEQKWIAKFPEDAGFGLTHVSSQEAIAAMHKANQMQGLEGNAGVKPTSLGEDVKHAVGAAVSDIPGIVRGIATTLEDPVAAGRAAGQYSREQIKQMLNSASQGKTAEAVGHAASAVPFVGAPARAIGEEYGRTGDLPRAVGRGGLLVAMTAAPEVVKGVGTVAKAAVPEAVSDALATKAGDMTAKAITPVRGAGATKFAGIANDIGEALATDKNLKGVTNPGFHVSVESELGKAADALDAASQQRLANKPIATQPIIDALQQRLQSKTQATPLQASQVGPPSAFKQPTGQNIGMGPGTPNPLNAAGMAGKAVPMGTTVRLSDPQTLAHAEQLSKAIDEIKALGPQTSYEALQKIRQSYDNVAKPGVYITQPSDVLTAGKNIGSARGAADVTGIVRETLAQADPVTAKANARYSLLRRADDVMEALKLSEQTRPTVGRTMLAAGMGAIGGGKLGALIGPIVDLGLRSGPNWQLAMGRQLGQLAQMIRTGDTAGVEAMAKKLTAAGFLGEAGEQKK